MWHSLQHEYFNLVAVLLNPYDLALPRKSVRHNFKKACLYFFFKVLRHDFLEALTSYKILRYVNKLESRNTVY